MKSIKAILTGILFGIFLLNANPAKAQTDLIVTCPPAEGVNTCTVSPVATPLFNETNWAPGDFTIKTFEVVNQDLEDSCNLTLETLNETQTPENFAETLGTALFDSANLYFLDLMQALFDAGPVSIGTVSPNSSNIYNWFVIFDPDAGNEFQNAQTIFDFNLAFVCNPLTTPTPTPTPTSTPEPGGGGGSVLSAAGAPVCNSAVPSSAPALTAAQAGTNSVLLTWTPVNNATHYMIRYGTTPGAYIYGAPNVGNTTSYTVNLLSSGATYYFQVAAVNNCMPGPWSAESSTRPTGVVFPIGPAPGFIETILGTSTEASASPSASPTIDTAGEVAAASTCTDPYYPWWIPLVIQIVATALYYLIIRSRKERHALWWLIPAMFAVISQIVHEILGCNCGTDWLCPWYWVFNLIIFTISGLFYYRWSQEQKQKKK